MVPVCGVCVMSINLKDSFALLSLERIFFLQFKMCPFRFLASQFSQVLKPDIGVENCEHFISFQNPEEQSQ